jgi:hypothetical protein
MDRMADLLQNAQKLDAINNAGRPGDGDNQWQGHGAGSFAVMLNPEPV